MDGLLRYYLLAVIDFIRHRQWNSESLSRPSVVHYMNILKKRHQISMLEFYDFLYELGLILWNRQGDAKFYYI